MPAPNEQNPIDPKGLIREAFRIEGIDASQCRSIFLDWALSLPADQDSRDAISALLERYADQPQDHPMRAVLSEGLAELARPRRRGGWRSRAR
ncbi:hypothetical protein PXK00_13855 [Phaeobacter sp. QD34_3]|uniref:hypothetical protein n=1 Tax=unclassified Phaeobacter TaxID=2621772 RepID=UPI00237F468C|nr:MULTISPECIES: hypothetical protein [unclassified Phaeobacter]MDE4134204.1 hypothetical protein [Phaeobacter sp. QD34_3]MDE4137873.1 hypothetical protein [Phaeobacter sp. QD34_24]